MYTFQRNQTTIENYQGSILNISAQRSFVLEFYLRTHDRKNWSLNQISRDDVFIKTWICFWLNNKGSTAHGLIHFLRGVLLTTFYSVWCKGYSSNKYAIHNKKLKNNLKKKQIPGSWLSPQKHINRLKPTFLFSKNILYTNISTYCPRIYFKCLFNSKTSNFFCLSQEKKTHCQDSPYPLYRFNGIVGKNNYAKILLLTYST